MKIIASAKMGHGTFQAKFLPLSKVDKVTNILVVRKSKGPKLEKVSYYILPKICKDPKINFILTPLILSYQAIKLKADVILCYHFVPHIFFGYIASLITSKPFIFAQTGGECEIMVRRNVFFKFVARVILKRTMKVFVPGVQSQLFWTEQFPTIDKKKFICLHSTIDTNYFRPIPDPKSEKYTYLFVGILNDRKQVDKIIKAFLNITKLYSDVSLGIVGTGPLEKELQRMVLELGLEKKVQFLGFQKDVRIFLNQAQIFVMASLMEGLPVALMEAMACEKVVIAPMVNNIPTVLRDGVTGLALRECNEDEITRKMLKAYENYDGSKLMRQAARDIIDKQYSYKSAIHKWNNLI